MKMLMICLVIALSAVAQSVTYTWQYSSNELALADTNGWSYFFQIHTTNQLGSDWTNWPLSYRQPATNTTIIGYNGSNYIFAATNPIAPGMAFSVATVSNIWGESGPSNTSSVPSLPQILHTTIIKN